MRGGHKATTDSSKESLLKTIQGMELDDNEKVQAIPGAENKGEIAYSQAITKLDDLKQAALKENISVQELQKIKEKILQVIQEAKDANTQQQSANDIATGLTFEELPPTVKEYYISKGVTATTTAIEKLKFINETLPDGFTIPNSITLIGNFAFFGAKIPDGFTIPSSVTSIGESAFNQATLGGSFNIPSSVTSIASAAFEQLIFPVGFTLPNSITRLEHGVFQNVILPDGFTLPSSVTLIGESAFSGAKLPVGFTIPSSVTSVGFSAFNGAILLNATPIQTPPQPNGNDLTLNSDGTWS